MGLPVVDFNEYRTQYTNVHICIACSAKYVLEIKRQLEEAGIIEYSIFDVSKDLVKDRLVSYAGSSDAEDVILYHVLKKEPEIFYIDVGCNDPFLNSVSKLFYDMKNAHGINIDPQSKLMEIVQRERPRDINLTVALGAEKGRQRLYFQGGRSTLVEGHVTEAAQSSADVEVVTLADVCEKYVNPEQDIHFLKIDVEGYEEQVLKGADFQRYRPWVLCIESTLPGTDEPSWEGWEPLVISAGYELALMSGVNRYYVAKEHKELDPRFLPLEQLREQYMIYQARFVAE